MLTKKSRFPRRPLGDAGDPSGFAQLTAEYCEWMRVRNFSGATIGMRRRVFDLFIVWALERGLSRPNEITRPILERYQRWLFHYRRENGKPLTQRGQITRLGPLRSFFSWLARQNRILYNPAADLDMPLPEKRLPKAVLTISEAETVLAQADTQEPVGLRDRAILETFYSTGMRRMELVGLKLVDLDAERGTVTIRQGKGKKDRVVPIGERALAWIEKYLQEVRPLLLVDPSEQTVFLTWMGGPFNGNAMTTLVAEYVTAAGIGKLGSCHLWRHTCATQMLEGGADIRYIQALLGHAQLTTTEIYTQVAIRKLKEIHTRTHPSARLERREPAVQAAPQTTGPPNQIASRPVTWLDGPTSPDDFDDFAAQLADDEDETTDEAGEGEASPAAPATRKTPGP